MTLSHRRSTTRLLTFGVAVVGVGLCLSTSGGCTRAGFLNQGAGGDGSLSPGDSAVASADGGQDSAAPSQDSGNEPDKSLIGDMRITVKDSRPGPSDMDTTPTTTVTAKHDTCASPAFVDLSGGSATISVNTQGAKLDYPFAFCGASAPEVVVRLVNPGTELRVRCTGGGGEVFLRYKHTLQKGACPNDTNGNTCRNMPCDGSNPSFISGTFDGFILEFYRDGTLGPAMVELTDVSGGS